MEVDIVEDLGVGSEPWGRLCEVLKNSLAFLRNRCEFKISEGSWTVDVLFGWMRDHFEDGNFADFCRVGEGGDVCTQC